MVDFFYETEGGYFYEVSGGKKGRRISRKRFEQIQKCGNSPSPKSDVRVGDKVRIAIKIDGTYKSCAVGVVKNVLTGSRFHSRGKKVRLTDGVIGRVVAIL